MAEQAKKAADDVNTVNGVYKWKHPDGSPTTKQERRILEETGSLPAQEKA